MGSREEILARLRAAAVPPVPLPEAGPGVRYPDLAGRFALAVAEAGGRCLRAASLEILEQVPPYLDARRVVSLVPGVRRANVDLAAVQDPHALEDVDFCVLPGELGVAENGAVWVTEHGGVNRAAAFLTQHLCLVVRAGTLVHNLHDAYARLSMVRPGFGLFLSGPSKTADIEQALVIGAHGARSCTVLLID